MNHPTPAGIEAALQIIDPVFLATPLRQSRGLDAEIGATLFLKDETANPIRSFKGRGTENFAAQFASGAALVCGSAGNFGQGLAWAARRRLVCCNSTPRNAAASGNAPVSRSRAMVT